MQLSKANGELTVADLPIVVAPVAIIEASADLIFKVQKALIRVRPYLHVDQGDVELMSIDEAAGIVEIRWLGNCATCSMSQMTLRAGVERAIMHEAPQIKRVEAVTTAR